MLNKTRIRLAIIVSHPIQYYAPLYQRLARRDDLEVKIFFTWHSGTAVEFDQGFKIPVAWDIPLTEGYAFELVQNTSTDPGTHRFFGLRNPTLVEQVLAWRPSVVHITGWAWYSHLIALRSFAGKGIPTLFRGDSHLLDSKRSGLRWWIKRAILRRVFSWPTAFLYVGSANRTYFEAFGVQPNRLFACPHFIDVARFAEPAEILDQEAAYWREQLHIRDDCPVLLFAGKFERKKRPVELMRAVLANARPDIVLILVGGGELANEVNEIATVNPDRFRVLPFQNQSRMSVVYRLGDLFILPSAFNETWGLAVNEAIASGRPALISDRVGCASDLSDGSCVRVFPWANLAAMILTINEMTKIRGDLRRLGPQATRKAWDFDVGRSEAALVECLVRVCGS